MSGCEEKKLKLRPLLRKVSKKKCPSLHDQNQMSVCNKVGTATLARG